MLEPVKGTVMQPVEVGGEAKMCELNFKIGTPKTPYVCTSTLSALDDEGEFLPIRDPLELSDEPNAQGGYDQPRIAALITDFVMQSITPDNYPYRAVIEQWLGEPIPPGADVLSFGTMVAIKQQQQKKAEAQAVAAAEQAAENQAAENQARIDALQALSQNGGNAPTEPQEEP